VGRLSARCDFVVVVVDFVECVVVGASVASPKQRMGVRTFGERVADVIDDGVGLLPLDVRPDDLRLVKLLLLGG